TGLRDDPGAVVEGARPEDVALVTGRTDDALDAFRDRIAQGAGDPETWVGLALAARAAGHPAGAPLLAAPELAMALHTGQDPLDLALALTPGGSPVP
ncbi:hypothetical protein ACWD25_01250, partial [Streptomyces sp. NPDC002920]